VAAGDLATAGLVRALDDTRRELRAAEARIADLQARGAYQGPARQTADADLGRLQLRLVAANTALLNANPRYEHLTAAPAGLAELQAALSPGEIYLKTLLLSDQGYGLLVTRDTATPYRIALGRQQASEAVLNLRAPFEAADEGLAPFDVAGSYRLYRAVFGPVEAQMAGSKRLIYEPDAVLASAPAAIFVTDQASVELMARRAAQGGAADDYRGVAWLGAKLDSALVLSTASFLQARAVAPSQAKRLFLGFANPTLARGQSEAYAAMLARGAEDLARSSDPTRTARICASSRRALLAMDALPETDQEARVIGAALGTASVEIVSGQDFDDAYVAARQDLGDFRIVYFATHALLPMPQYCLPEPALLTSFGGGASDGFLDAGEIINLKLDADLVVLSACDTGGAGDEDGSGGGEALGGLTRAVIYAGARSLVVSHWSVDSLATETLMTDFFRSGGSNLAAGLRLAQLKMQADPARSHPFFWAPFTIVGDGAKSIPQAVSYQAQPGA
jgi:CHAT domain-containing protein